MSTENNLDTGIEIQENLDDFAADFFGGKQEPSDNAKSEDGAELEGDSSAQSDEETDTQSVDNDGVTKEESNNSTEETSETETDEDDGKAKAKPTRLQERINELTAARREAERRVAEFERRAVEAEARLQELQKPKATNEAKASGTEPSPTDKNEDGSDKYPLGEFDPKYLKDVVQHMLNEQQAQQQEKAAQEAKLTEEEEYRATLQGNWETKLVDVQERYPDFREKGEQMVEVFEGIDDAYGQYLTDTLMEMDAGAEVFYYLSNNLDEAKAIVNAGPRKATLALAKIEARLAGTPAEKTPVVKTSNAPKPPPQLKGSSAAKASIPLDTDDLDAFSKVLFSKK